MTDLSFLVKLTTVSGLMSSWFFLLYDNLFPNSFFPVVTYSCMHGQLYGLAFCNIFCAFMHANFFVNETILRIGWHHVCNSRSVFLQGTYDLTLFSCGFNYWLLQEGLSILAKYKRPLLVHSEIQQDLGSNSELKDGIDDVRSYSTYLKSRPPSWYTTLLISFSILCLMAKLFVNSSSFIKILLICFPWKWNVVHTCVFHGLSARIF